MAATKVWKKLRRVEKVGLMSLCVVMLLTLGIGGSTVFGSCDKVAGAGSMVIDGETVEIDPVEYREFVNGHWTVARIYADRLRRETPKLTDDTLEQQFMIHRLAVEAGIVVPDDALRAYIEEGLFANPQTGKFDRDLYEATLARHRVTQRAFEKAMRANLEVAEYMSLFQNSVDPTMKEIYARFRERNKKYRVEYVWSSLTPFEEQVKVEELTEEEVAEYYKTIEYRHTVPIRRKLEAAYVTLVDVPAEEFDALYEKWGTEPDLKVSFRDGLMYWRRQRGLFTDEALKTIRQGKKEPADEEKEPEVDVGSDGDDTGETSPGGENDDPPVDRTPPAGEAPVGEVAAGEVPADQPDPEPVSEAGTEDEPAKHELSEREIYETYWEDLIRKEVFFRRLAGRVLVEVRDSEAPLARIAEKYGFRHVETEFLEDEEIASIAAIGFGGLRDEVLKYEDPRRHDGHVLPRVLPTTDTSLEPLRRGWQVVRLVTIDKPHPSPLADVIEEVREEYREKKVHDLGTADLETLRDEASKAGADFKALVEARGLPLKALAPFGSRSTPPAPDTKKLESEDEEVRARAEVMSRDFTVMTRGLANLRGLRNKEYTLPLIDARTSSVILVHLLGKEDPDAEEMTVRDIRTIRTELYRTQVMMILMGRFSVESLRERLRFERPGR